MSCCTILTAVLAALTSYFIIYRIPTTPNRKELLKIQKRRQMLKLKAGVYRHRTLGPSGRES